MRRSGRAPGEPLRETDPLEEGRGREKLAGSGPLWREVGMTKTLLAALAFVVPVSAAASDYEMIPTDQLEVAVGRRIDPSQGLMLADAVQSGSSVTYNFPAIAGQSYVLSTYLGSLPDRVMELRGADNATVLAVNDDAGGSFASQITWTAQATETLHVSVRAYSSSQSGRFAISVAGLFASQCDAVWPCVLEESVPAGGARWYAFFANDNAMNGLDATFGLETALGTLEDTTMHLYAADGATLLGYNDDVAPPDRHSALEHTVARGSAGARLRFVKIAPYSPTQHGSYLLSLASNDHPADLACIEVCEEAEDLGHWIACVADHCG